MVETTDRAVAATLARFAAVSARLLDDPGAWLGHGEGGAGRGRLLRAALAVRGLVTGGVHPGAPAWAAQPVERRVGWWVHRIQVVAAPIAATPRFFGAAADRLPVQAAFGAAVAGLAVCATAREHGRDRPEDWVPLLGRVLLDRDVARPDDVGPAPDDEALPVVPDLPGAPQERAGPVRRAVGGLWQLTRILWEVAGIFDERPRGAWAWRALGKLPVVGLAGGILDEGGAVRRASRETADLLRS